MIYWQQNKSYFYLYVKKIILLCSVVVLVACDDDPPNCSFEDPEFKINGGSILQTWLLAGNDVSTLDLKQKTNANWVSLSPIVGIADWCDGPCRPYCFPISSEIEKMNVLIPKVINSGLENIMLKPITAFWIVNGSGYWGDFYVSTEKEWEEIEKAYEELYVEFAKLSERFPEVKILSIGTELKKFSKRRPQFFKALISKIKTAYPNLKLTYAANWDEYQNISFWQGLDYIGINSFFPLVNKKTPSIDEIKQALVAIKNRLQNFSCAYQKPILFTEYGYRSIDYGAWKQWLLGEVNSQNINFEVQKNSYIAFYDTFWAESWVAGGFFWEWKLLLNNETNNPNENGWYINDKPAQTIIKQRYAYPN